jgi:hypothetical protein
MIHGGEGEVGSPNPEPALAELSEGLRRRHLVNKVTIDGEDCRMIV